MSISVESRFRLAAEQAALVAALTADGAAPLGFDMARVKATAMSLSRKRVRATARAWRELSRTLGRTFVELFAEYAATNQLPREGGALADGRCFVRWLAARGTLPEAGRRQALAVDLHYRSTAHGLQPRRWPCMRWDWMPESRRLVVAARLPWIGERWANMPLSWGRVAAKAK